MQSPATSPSIDPTCAMQVSLSYHDGLGCGTVSADDSWRAADDSRGQWGVDGVGKLCKLWVLFPDVLNHLGLKNKVREARMRY